MLPKRILKICLIISGLLLVGIGVLGIFIPGLPTTIFLIAAAACFAKSSPCLHAWLMSHPWFGSLLHNWQQSRSIPKKAKIIALMSMLVAAIYSALMLESWLLIASILLVMIFPAIYVFNLPLTENLAENLTENQNPNSST